jgi:UDP-glucuronate 4-epimerase
LALIVTGAAGFIGSHVAKALLARGETVIGVDNLNSYYDPQLKQDRLAGLQNFPNFQLIKADVQDREAIFALIDANPQVEVIVHLAAQAGVRYSIEDPYSYINSNVMGQTVIFEAAKRMKHCRNLVYASSSSVYGRNEVQPFSIDHAVSHPSSIYAATKLAAEHLAEAYSWGFKIPTIGLRFFTVYGPWGRPDMAPHLFSNAIVKGEPIKVFNHGNMYRDFTFIDDIVAGVLGAIDHPPQAVTGQARHKIYNLGSKNPEKLMDFIATLEAAMGRTTEKVFLPMQTGDVVSTSADITESIRDLGFKPTTTIADGLPQFAAWYKAYYGVN